MSRILFATSNGTGLGHLTRAIAIARRLDPSIHPLAFTLSQAAPVVAREGIAVEYFPSYRRPASGSDWQWNLRLRRRFELLLDEIAPALVVFDGVHPYRGITHVLSRRQGAPAAIWCRRPMWRPGGGAAAIARTGAFDAVLEPGELAEAADRGLTAKRRTQARRVAPIVHLDRDELLPREQAERELGLEPGGGPTAFVSLGQGGAVDAAVARSIERLSAEPGLRVVVLESSLAPGLEVPEGVTLLRATFPVSRFFRAFDLAIAASGYNAFHEHVAFAVPTVFVPMPREMDDQAARARWAHGSGLGLAAAGPDDPELEALIVELLDPERRAAIRARLEALDPPIGAAEAARLLEGALAGELGPPRVRDRGAFNRWYRLSSHPVGPSLPLAAALTARDLIRHPERRDPNALVLALAAPENELAQLLRGALTEIDAAPGRTLVITDSLDFPVLRELGVAFERVPTAAELADRGVTLPYEQVIARRVAEVLRGRRPREGAVIGSAPAALAEVPGMPTPLREILRGGTADVP